VDGFLDGVMVGKVGLNVGGNEGTLVGLRVAFKQVPHETGHSLTTRFLVS